MHRKTPDWLFRNVSGRLVESGGRNREVHDESTSRLFIDGLLPIHQAQLTLPVYTSDLDRHSRTLRLHSAFTRPYTSSRFDLANSSIGSIERISATKVRHKPHLFRIQYSRDSGLDTNTYASPPHPSGLNQISPTRRLAIVPRGHLPRRTFQPQ